jgi:regulator of replication initiation timing
LGLLINEAARWGAVAKEGGKLKIQQWQLELVKSVIKQEEWKVKLAKHDTDLVPYEELLLQIFQTDLHVCQLKFDNSRSVVFVCLMDKA